ncbi:MAG TPA: MBL fold metallo-hydrolase [Methylomirabilota bacterium]|nr:MBL fold metallo-hydrolase [Methylomirabilota bacterium]
MIKPLLQGEALLREIAQARQEPDHLHLWWLGQSGFLIQWQGRHLLLDPYLSDSLTKKYATTDKPHVRMTELVIQPEQLDFIDVVTSSHNHTDHLDADTLLPLFEVNPNLQFVIPEANREFVAERLKMPAIGPIGLDAGQSVEVGGFKFHGVPAAHEQIDRDPQARCKHLGYVIQAGPWVIYHSGDTVRYEGMAETLRNWKIDIALLPINGRAPERRVAGNLDGPEAAQLAKDIGAGLVIPCHYEMFEFNTASPDAFAHAAQAIGQNIRILRCGERMNLR